MAQIFSETLLCIWIFLFTIGIVKIGVFPLKTIILMVFIFCTIYTLKDKNCIIISYKWNIFFVGFWTVIATAIGFFHGFYQSGIDQDLSLCATLSVVICTFLLYDNCKLNSERVRRVIFLTAVIGMLAKVFLGVGLLLDFFSPESIQNIMQTYFGSQIFDAGQGFGFLGVLPKMGDSGNLFNLIVYMFYVKKNDGGSVLLWIVTLLFVLVGYSRYLMACFGLITLYIIGFYFIKSRLNFSKFIKAGLFLLLLFMVNYFIEFDTIWFDLVERYTGQIQSASDSIRTIQKDILLVYIKDNFLFGLGLGGYATDYLRGDIHLWQYELEYLSLLMQLGVVGFLFIVINFMTYIICKLFCKYDKGLKLPMIISLVFWLGTPFQSALFLGTQSALIAISIFFLSRKRENA